MTAHQIHQGGIILMIVRNKLLNAIVTLLKLYYFHCCYRDGEREQFLFAEFGLKVANSFSTIRLIYRIRIEP